MIDLENPGAVQQYGLKLGQKIMDSVGDWQHNSPRTQQSRSRVLGMSELGGCREYIRATIAGDPKDPVRKIKWAAFIGTAVGDMMETALVTSFEKFAKQGRVTLHLPRTGVEVSGSSDGRMLPPGEHSEYPHGGIIDFKSKDGIAEIQRSGPELKECVQISGYLIAEVDAGNLPPTAMGHLVYIDRSGKVDKAWVYTVTVADARRWLDLAEQRLLEVADAIATGTSQSYLRDQAESKCWYFQCPFYTACWSGYQPTEEITMAEVVEAVAQYVDGRNMAKDAKTLMDNAKLVLNPDPEHPESMVRGRTPDGTTVNWKDTARGGELFYTIDVRSPRD